MIIPSFGFSGRIFVTDLAVSSEITASPQAAKPVGVTNEIKFRQQIARECDAMARYALGAGLKMPPTLVQSLDVFENVIEHDDTDRLGGHSHHAAQPVGRCGGARHAAHDLSSAYRSGAEQLALLPRPAADDPASGHRRRVLHARIRAQQHLRLDQPQKSGIRHLLPQRLGKP